MSQMFAVLVLAALLIATQPLADSTRRPAKEVFAILTIGASEEDCPGGGAVLGKHIFAEDLDKALAELQGYQRLFDGIILHFQMGADLTSGGDPLEAERMLDVIEEHSKKIRLIGWIESATDVAAIPAYAVRELYIFPTGALGAAVLQGPALDAAPASLQERWIETGRRAARIGGRPAEVILAMQTVTPLSCTVTAAGREWRHDETGETVVNRRGRNLTLNAQEAVQLGIATAVAGSQQELLQAMGGKDHAAFISSTATQTKLQQRIRERCAAGGR
jgi:hypothetical protein